MADKKLAIIRHEGHPGLGLPAVHSGLHGRGTGYETQIFFTFYGLQLLRKKLDLKVSPLGNPGMR